MRPPVFFFLPLLPLSILFLLQDPCFSFVRMGGALIVESKSCNRMSLATALSSSTSTAYAYGGGESLICHASNAIIICQTVLSSWIVGANTIFRPSAISCKMSGHRAYDWWQLSTTNLTGASPRFMATAIAHAQGNLYSAQLPHEHSCFLLSTLYSI